MKETIHSLDLQPFYSHQSHVMDFEEFHSDIRGEYQPAPLGVSDIEAVEALVSMTKQWKTTSSRSKHLRPLSPSSDCSEDDSSPRRFNVQQETLLVSDSYEVFRSEKARM